MTDKQEKLLEDISRKLNALLSISLRNLIENKDFSVGPKRKQGIGKLVYYFADFGLNAKDIADILGTPVQSIRTLLTPRRRRK